MYKKLILSIFAVLLSQLLFSQDQWNWDITNPKQNNNLTINIGPKAGVGIALGSNSTTNGFDFKNGLAYQVGASINLHFGRRYPQSPEGTGWIGFGTEILYGIRNIRQNSQKLTLRCFEIPALVQIYPTPSLAIEAGATFVKIINCSPEWFQIGDMAFLQTGEISGGDVMVTFGACYKAPFKLIIDVRYNIGTSNLAGNFGTKVSSLMFSVAYLFDLIK